jgi:hypothetical protein
MSYRFCSISLKSFLLISLLACSHFACSPATDTSINNNLESGDNAAGGFVWGQNDLKTGKHKEEKTDKEIILRQEEVLRRQELEKARLEKEKQDILRQKYYNEKLKLK